MRVVIIAPPWVSVPPRAYGGTEAVLDVLARGLQAAGDEVLLVTTGDSRCPVPKTAVFDRAVGVGTAGIPAEVAHVLHGYAEAVRFRADIVHDHTLVGPLCAAHRSDLRVVTTNHGPFDGELEALYRAVAGRVPTIAISHDQASRARDIPVAAIVHHGLVMADYPVGDGKAGHAVFLGRMHPSKGVDRACQIARKAGVPLLIGAKMSEPAEHAYFARCVQPLLGGGIEYVGELDAAAKVELLGGARCLLNPITWHEPFGMVMIEALACGTPVVARSMGAAPEIVADGVTGALAAGDDDLARAVREATGFSRDRCRRDAVARFSDARMVGAHRELYERVLGGASTPRRELLAEPRRELSAAAG